jgi:glycosyltransferase involved in cell wall biosynthesis
MAQTIRLLAIIEGTTVSGPAKNLINFCRGARSTEWQIAGLPRVETSIVTFQRHGGPSRSRRDGRAASSEESGRMAHFVEAAQAAGIAVDVVYERFRFDARVIGQLRRVVERRAPDVIQTHMVKSHFLVKVSGLGARYPWVAYHHGYTTTDLKMRAYNQLDRWSLPSATRIITVCGHFARQLAGTGVSLERISVRHNSVSAGARVSAEDTNRLKADLGVTEGERLVLAVGRLSREKGQEDLVQALDMLRQINPTLKTRLVFVGDGPDRARIERTVHAHRLTDSVVFVGHASDVRPYYAVADALALPSHSEGSPNVLLEAMASGLPVVATSVGGVPEMVLHEESALLVPPHDPHSFAAALNQMLTDQALRKRLAESAAARAAIHFSPESYIRSLLAIYRELVPDNSSR